MTIIFAIDESYISDKTKTKLMKMRQGGVNMSAQFEKWVEAYPLPERRKNDTSSKSV